MPVAIITGGKQRDRARGRLKSSRRLATLTCWSITLDTNQYAVSRVTADEWQGVIDVNLTGAFLAGQAAARRMVDQAHGGAIINVTCVHEHIPLSGSAPYTASEHGLGGADQRDGVGAAFHTECQFLP